MASASTNLDRGWIPSLFFEEMMRRSIYETFLLYALMWGVRMSKLKILALYVYCYLFNMLIKDITIVKMKNANNLLEDRCFDKF